jgi:hypothetical protein
MAFKLELDRDTLDETLGIEAEVIEADIEIETDRPTLEVWSIDSEGFYAGRIDSKYEDGRLKFTIGEEFACMYYLIFEP